MTRSVTRFLTAFLVSSAIVLAYVPFGSSAEGDDKAISDEWCGFSVSVAEPWQRAALSGYTAPGAIRCAWSGPNNASIVIFIQEPGVAVSPRVMLDGSVKAQKDKLGATVSVEAVRAIADMQAMWMVVSGKGNGGAIDNKGNIKTTQHWVAVPRERDVVVVLLTCPESNYAQLQKSFEALVASLKLSGSQTAEQKSAK